MSRYVGTRTCGPVFCTARVPVAAADLDPGVGEISIDLAFTAVFVVVLILRSVAFSL
ncbi:hypothetical protein [Saccharopolyspora terrae]|uniref:hypothetical protein n=1 Tax=Saccharopolyspora terrae TaxID=2530384 RepID=UPI001A9CED13|nr:hypothetical protein [Saccharopolyspora terrae]